MKLQTAFSRHFIRPPRLAIAHHPCIRAAPATEAHPLARLAALPRRERLAACFADSRFMESRIPSGVFRAVVMVPAMANPVHQLKVFHSVVQWVFVFVMDDLMRFQRAPQHPAHHKSMLWHVAVLACVWMLWGKNVHVAISYYPAFVPSVVPLPARLMTDDVQSVLASSSQPPDATATGLYFGAAPAHTVDFHTSEHSRQTNTYTVVRA